MLYTLSALWNVIWTWQNSDNLHYSYTLENQIQIINVSDNVFWYRRNYWPPSVIVLKNERQIGSIAISSASSNSHVLFSDWIVPVAVRFTPIHRRLGAKSFLRGPQESECRTPFRKVFLSQWQCNIKPCNALRVKIIVNVMTWIWL